MSKPLRIAYIAPRIGELSTTFVYRDIAGLRAQGVEVAVFSVQRPDETVLSDEARPFIEETQYLYDHGAAAFLAAALRQAVRRPVRFARTLGACLHDLVFAETPRQVDRPKFVWHFLAGCLLAERLDAADARHIHCNFAHTPAGIAMYAAMLRGIPFSFLCHAHDIFVHAAAMREKVARAAFGMCSSRYNVRFLADTKGCDGAKLDVMRTGLDLNRFGFRAPKPFSKPFRFLSVGRLVEKKGFPVFFDALALLAKRGRDFQADIVGGGPMDPALRKQAEDLGLAGRIHLAGPQPQERVRQYYDEADAFVLACLEAGNRDMDGTPIVLIEAMALGVPVISTPVSGNPELIDSGSSGLLVSPGDAAALANAMERLMDDPERTRRLAESARRTIESGFDLDSNIARLVQAIEKAVART